MGDLEYMLRTVRDINLKNKRVLIRVDFNVPIDDKGNVTDDFRIRSSLPTINYCLEQGASQVVLMSHLDPWKENPASDKYPRDSRLEMDKVAETLSDLIGEKVSKVDDCVDIVLPDTRIVLLENLRFYKGEKKDDLGFAQKLARHGDVYVNDAFGTSHRKHASVHAITRYFEEPCAGLLVEKEVRYFQPVMSDPDRPFYVILGGIKVSSKIDVIESLAQKADKLFIGGRMALAFADSELIGQEERDKAKKLLEKYSDKIVLPLDYVAEDKQAYDLDNLPHDKNLYDIGPKTIEDWKDKMSNAQTIVANVILGYVELNPFDNGTKEMIGFMADSKAVTIIGGGDSVSAVMKSGRYHDIDHVSTGGGASLELLEGKKLPGLEVLN
jgi:phosphoglycerate kinase|tara:strand:- start:831 stop:1979 length:1149 start_codon:yes stop_codon:yes gene_type:complete